MRAKPRVLVVADKFRGTLSSWEAGTAIASGLAGLADVEILPMSDGGEGFLECFGGPNQFSRVPNAWGREVEVGWRLGSRVAVIESAACCGHVASPLGEGSPVRASTDGVGVLIAHAIAAGARRVIVGAGGSVTTDGGRGALRALAAAGFAGPSDLVDLGVELVVAHDVGIVFKQAAVRFGEQKGASRSEIDELTRRLGDLAAQYEADFGIDVAPMRGGGSAGGLGGGLVAFGARLQAGFDIVAQLHDLDNRIAQADLVITGEGALDASSFDGKVVGQLFDICRHRGLAFLCLVGENRLDAAPFPIKALADAFGRETALAEPGTGLGALARRSVQRALGTFA